MHLSPVADPLPEGNQDFYEAGRRLFAQSCSFLAAAAGLAAMPEPGPPEIAFAGRSNVGKSSLLNALTGRKALARISRTPGRTQELNFFDLGGTGDVKLRLVDMPGYGYAAAGKDKSASWFGLIKGYLRSRRSLLRVFVLLDGRHGVKPVDNEMLDLLAGCAVPFQLVLTKKDEVAKARHDENLAAALALAASRPAAFPEVIFTSSRSGEGIGELRVAIARLLSERGSLER